MENTSNCIALGAILLRWASQTHYMLQHNMASIMKGLVG